MDCARAKIDTRERIHRNHRVREMLGLEWTDLEFTRGLIQVQRAVYEARKRS